MTGFIASNTTEFEGDPSAIDYGCAAPASDGNAVAAKPAGGKAGAGKRLTAGGVGTGRAPTEKEKACARPARRPARTH